MSDDQACPFCGSTARTKTATGPYCRKSCAEVDASLAKELTPEGIVRIEALMAEALATIKAARQFTLDPWARKGSDVTHTLIRARRGGGAADQD